MSWQTTQPLRLLIPHLPYSCSPKLLLSLNGLSEASASLPEELVPLGRGPVGELSELGMLKRSGVFMRKEEEEVHRGQSWWRGKG